jgi:hypothetical protein
MYPGVDEPGRLDKSLEVTVYCMGRENREFRHNSFENIGIKQYAPNLSVRDFVPL